MDKTTGEILYREGADAEKFFASKGPIHKPVELTDVVLDDNGFAEGSTGARLKKLLKDLIKRRTLISRATRRAEDVTKGNIRAREVGVDIGSQRDQDNPYKGI